MRTSAREIMTHVSAAYGLSLEDLRGGCRARRVARPRQIALYLCRRLTRQSTTQLGLRFNCDHSNVIAARRRIESLMAQDTRFGDEVEALRAALAKKET